METLKSHRSRPLLQLLDLTQVSVKDMLVGRATFEAQIKASEPKMTVVPEHEAFWFYLRNHAQAVVARMYDVAEPLPEPVAHLVREYHVQGTRSMLRMYYYLVQICTRESRHAGGGKDQLLAKYPELKQWYMGYHGTNSEHAVTHLLNNPPDVNMGRLTQFLVDSFYECKYGSSFGGKAWGAIADVLRDFVHGRITGEMMLDTAWTLCHNNGPIFNKGMWYSMYSDDAIKEILDVQRAGMIPQYIADVAANKPWLSHCPARGFVTEQMKAYVAAMGAMSTDFTGSVRWGDLKKLGALGDYSYLAKKQDAHKPPSMLDQIKAKQAAAQQAKLEATKWQVMPGVVAYKETKKRKAEKAPAPVIYEEV